MDQLDLRPAPVSNNLGVEFFSQQSLYLFVINLLIRPVYPGRQHNRPFHFTKKKFLVYRKCNLQLLESLATKFLSRGPLFVVCCPIRRFQKSPHHQSKKSYSSFFCNSISSSSSLAVSGVSFKARPKFKQSTRHTGTLGYKICLKIPVENPFDNVMTHLMRCLNKCRGLTTRSTIR